MKIRLANLADREILGHLYHEFHQFHVQGVPDRLVSLGKPPDKYKNSELFKTLEKIIKDDNSAIFVAELDSKIVGLAEVYFRKDEPNPLKVSYRYGFIQSLIVTESFRKRQIGTSLLKAAEQWAKEKGAIEMRLDIWEFIQGPLGFYEKREYQTLRRTLVRKL
jgi:GNAT superfamily N-acetyltransferase